MGSTIEPKRRLPYGKQWLDDADVQALVDTARGDYLTTGPRVDALEARLAELVGQSHAVAVNSGTSALHCLYYGARIGKGDEIVTSPLTFVATAAAALHLGADVKFADVDADTGLLNPGAAEAACSDRTRAIVAVDYAGQPADYDALRAVLPQKARLFADAAHSLGAMYKGKPACQAADGSTFSFHPVKPVTTAEGGAIVTADRGLADRARLYRCHGMVREVQNLTRKDVGPWYYEVTDIGHNFRITDLQCALGLSQLDKLARFITRRRKIAENYQRVLADIAEIDLPSERPDCQSGWHIYVLRVKDKKKRRPFFEALRERGLGVQVHYLPVHLHPYFERLGYKKGSCPVAEDFYDRCLSIPLYPSMDQEDIDYVVDQVHNAAKAVL